MIAVRRSPAKLSEATALAIIALLAKSYTASSIAKQFGVHASTVSKIKSGETWKHLPRPEGFAPRDGRNDKQSTLTKAQVKEIIALREAGYFLHIIAAQFNVVPSTIHRITPTVRPGRSGSRHR
jgi:IS30 family transposase